MTEEDHSPTLEEAQERFLATIQAKRTADTYGWALNAFRRFVGERAKDSERDEQQ
jgi:hypothetical protein